MIIHRAYRYRIYPTPEQAARIGAWVGALRFLWNLAHEQRLMGLAHARDFRHYFTAFDQINELADLRAELPWLADVPRNACAQLLVELDRAWQRCFKKLARQPRWKKKGRDRINPCEPHHKTWSLASGMLHFPKLGRIRAIVHRPLCGTPKTCRLIQEVDQWFVDIVCEEDVADPVPRFAPVVALDRGVVNIVADSDGRIVPAHRSLKHALRRLAHAQRVVSRRKKGSHRREKAKQRVAKLHRKVRRQRAHAIHTLSHDYSKSHATVVIEHLNTKGMVRANRGLARGILDAAWGKLAFCLKYKLEATGGRLIEVPAAYSSQECSACGCVDAASRRSQSEFRCTTCGYSDHADLNAAKNLLGRANHPALNARGGDLKLGPQRNGKVVRLRNPKRLLQSLAL